MIVVGESGSKIAEPDAAADRPARFTWSLSRAALGGALPRRLLSWVVRRQEGLRVEVCDNTPLNTLGLSVRALRTAEAAGATTVGELCRLSEERVLSAKGFADVSLQELRAKLSEHGRRMEGRWPES